MVCHHAMQASPNSRPGSANLYGAWKSQSTTIGSGQHRQRPPSALQRASVAQVCIACVVVRLVSRQRYSGSRLYLFHDVNALSGTRHQPHHILVSLPVFMILQGEGQEAARMQSSSPDHTYTTSRKAMKVPWAGSCAHSVMHDQHQWITAFPPTASVTGQQAGCQCCMWPACTVPGCTLHHTGGPNLPRLW
jgi:hypothetical protein